MAAHPAARCRARIRARGHKRAATKRTNADSRAPICSLADSRARGDDGGGDGGGGSNDDGGGERLDCDGVQSERVRGNRRWRDNRRWRGLHTRNAATINGGCSGGGGSGGGCSGGGGGGGGSGGNCAHRQASRWPPSASQLGDNRAAFSGSRQHQSAESERPLMLAVVCCDANARVRMHLFCNRRLLTCAPVIAARARRPHRRRSTLAALTCSGALAAGDRARFDVAVSRLSARSRIIASRRKGSKCK